MVLILVFHFDLTRDEMHHILENIRTKPKPAFLKFRDKNKFRSNIEEPKTHFMQFFLIYFFHIAANTKFHLIYAKEFT